MAPFEDSYIKSLRDSVGSSLLLVPGAQVLVMRADGKILLQRRSDNGVWEIPAGSCEPGQSFRTAASNELLEETGIEASTESLVAFASFSDSAECQRRAKIDPLLPLGFYGARGSVFSRQRHGPGLVLTRPCAVVLSVISFCPFGRGTGGAFVVIL